MRISRSASYALGVLAAAALLAGCSSSGGSQSGFAPGAGAGASGNHVSVPQVRHHGLADTYVSVKPAQVHPDHHKSWVSPDAKLAPRLYFASDSGTDDVYIFTMPGMALKGTLTGFSEPQGECADTKGNIYIANTGTEQVLEYSRTGTLLNTYSDSYGYPVGCAINPMNGDLAVADIFGFSGAGQVLVYSSPSSSPTVLSNPNQYYYYFDGYDKSGDLWVSGKDESGSYMVSDCGASSCSTVSLSGGTIYFPGAVQWDGTSGNWVLFDQLCNDSEAACSYPVSASGVLGSPTIYENYNGTSACDIVQGVIAANMHKYVAGGDYEYCGNASTSVNRWAYPAGGKPTNYSTSSISEPIGAAISTK